MVFIGEVGHPRSQINGSELYIRFYNTGHGSFYTKDADATICLDYLSVQNWARLGQVIHKPTELCTPKAHIPPETSFALGSQCKQKGDKQHEMYMPKANPT